MKNNQMKKYAFTTTSLKNSILLSGFFTALVLAQSVTARPVAEGNLNMETGMMCFPLQLTTTSTYYNACLHLDRLAPTIKFSLVSTTLASSTLDLASIPTYSQLDGLRLPLVRLSDGRIYTGARLKTVLEPNGTVSFEVESLRRLALDLDHSTARIWNEALLSSIRNDLARPTVHARNLFHTSVAMYDAWAAFDTSVDTYLLGKSLNGYSCGFSGITAGLAKETARKQAISYAAYNLLKYRFAKSPGAGKSLPLYTDLMLALGLDPEFSSRDYSSGSAAALGNHIAECIIAYGLQDGSNEALSYAAINYKPFNAPFFPANGGTTISNPDRWQPLSFEQFIDQSGNVFAGSTPPALTHEWGNVAPFAMTQADLTNQVRDGFVWKVYHDPGSPPVLANPATADDYKWGFELVAIWSSHLATTDNVLWDISPAGLGNIADYPTTLAGYRSFYDLKGGGDTSRGRDINPVTGKPYVPQIVPRGDYTRVLAEFWADGPQSETPPGHWFTILNYVSDHPLFAKHFRGTGPLLNDLEWDVKAYLALGGAMHDAAITAWGIKGYYDYVRPISAIRYLAGQGQSSDSLQPSYDPDGIHLIPGYIELIKAGDPLAGVNGEHIGKIKLLAWLAHDKIKVAATDQAGVGWIRAENWYPYQRPSFVTPPFAGYISGHSTFSRAAAEVMTLLTGDEYFPGGMSEFVAKKNEYLVFEEGPSMDVILQWATYRDASDQTSLSRIWGGIHPPQDDIPGRRLGAIIGVEAFEKAESYFHGTAN